MLKEAGILFAITLIAGLVLGLVAGIEVWKYDPALLSETGVVDKLSLYLLLKDYEDERVQIELDNMIKDIAW